MTINSCFHILMCCSHYFIQDVAIADRTACSRLVNSFNEITSKLNFIKTACITCDHFLYITLLSSSKWTGFSNSC